MSSLNSNFQPYGFLLNPKPRKSSTPGPDFLAHSGGNSLDSPGFTTPHQACERADSPPTPVSLEATSSAISVSEHGRFLGEKLDFIVTPTDLRYVDHDVTPKARCLFIGQLRFETSAEELRFLIERLAGATPLRAEARGPGCFVVYVGSEADEVLVRTLNRRLLFDHNGVWFARTPDATEILLDYVETTLPTLRSSRRRALRLPRDCIVVEDSRTKKNVVRSPPSRPSQPYAYQNNFYHNQPPPVYGSEPTTPSSYSRSGSGFHGHAPPEYVFGDCAAPPPPYSSAW